MARVKKRKARERYQKAMDRARDLLQQTVKGNLDPYIAYRQLYGMYCANTPLHKEFGEFFAIPGVEPDGWLRVDDRFRKTVRDLARKWLAKDLERATTVALRGARRTG